MCCCSTAGEDTLLDIRKGSGATHTGQWSPPKGRASMHYSYVANYSKIIHTNVLAFAYRWDLGEWIGRYRVWAVTNLKFKINSAKFENLKSQFDV
jgi:hypothetical protein